MKKIKELLPVWLILVYFVSIIYMIQERSGRREEYIRLVEQARTLAKTEVVSDAMDMYEEALNLNSNIGLAIEAGNMLLEYDRYADARKWFSNRIHSAFPDEQATYDYGIRMYVAQENYNEAFKLYRECEDRELLTEDINNLMIPYLYSFDLRGQYEDVYPYSNLSNLAAVKYNGLWGYVDIKGSRVTDYTYLSAGMFSDKAAVIDDEGEVYFVDSSGEKKITDKTILEVDPELGQIERFYGIEGNVLWAFNGEIWNAYDASNYKKLFGGYRGITNVSNGVCGVMDEESKWALIAADGTPITDFIFDEVLTDEKGICCRTDSLIVQKDGYYSFIDKNGNEVGEKYTDACAFFDSTYAAVEKDGNWTFVDSQGNDMNLGSYEKAKSFSNGLAAVYESGRWGYIDIHGNLVIDYQFENVESFSNSGTTFIRYPEDKYWQLLRLFKDNYQ